MPIDPSRLNAVGDLVLTEAEELRALADPVRLELFDLVRRHGPLTVADACTRLGLETDAVSSQLRRLADAGLIDRDTAGTWSTDARGIYFEIPDEPEAQRAARELSNTMLVKYGSLPAEWVRRFEPQLDVTWARAAGLFNARIDLTADELRRLQEELEQLLEPFTNRSADDRPADAAPVRITAYFLPEPGRDMAVTLRPLADGDLDALFDWERDARAVEMAAFTRADPSDRSAFDAHYERVRGNPSNTLLAIDHDAEFVGTIGSFTREGDREVTYWIAPARWGQGLASQALRAFLAIEPARPLYGRVAEHNAGSAKVLARAGFVQVGTETGFAPGIGRDVVERIYRLDR